MGLHSPSLARCEIMSGGIARSTTSLKQQLNSSHNFLHSVSLIPVSQKERGKLKNVVGFFSKGLPVTVSVGTYSCKSQRTQRQVEIAGNPSRTRGPPQNSSKFVNYSNCYGEEKRRQSNSTNAQPSTRIETQQQLAADCNPNSLEEVQVCERRSEENDDSMSDSTKSENQNSSIQVNSGEAAETREDQRWPVGGNDDHDNGGGTIFQDVENVSLPKRKKKGLGIRKPLQEVEKSDFTTRFGFSAQPRASYRQEPEAEALPSDVEYYEPKAGDEVIGVVVSGSEYKIDVDIGAEQLGRVLIKDIYPLDLFRSDEFFWEFPAAEEALSQELPIGRVRICREEEVLTPLAPRSPIVDVGSVLRFKVVGVTLSGRPILSARKIAFPLSWERVRQIKDQNEPIEVKIHEWNSGGLLTKIEGIRAFLPINHLLNRSMGTVSLRARVGEKIRVLITEVDEKLGKLIISEKRAWGLKNLCPGALHDGTVNKIFPFGVEVNLAGTSLRGMIHISNVSRSRVKDLEQVFHEGEAVKVIVVKSPVPYRISLSTADLESSKGLILEDKERVFREAEELAARFRSSLPEEEEDQDGSSEREMIEQEVANWDWLDFGEETGSVDAGQVNGDQ
ncbi:hypothetical protein R1sor_018335 [Riccia sorocarpa]|uniref:S1 motif domain-containing protein n=1 Tax=Riccia sorocarpa TaxID=122646 RepID=A0ABD3I9D8_9MARC